MRIDPDTVLRRVRQELAGRREAEVARVKSPLPHDDDTEVHQMPPAAPPLPMKEQYELAELLAYSDVAFVEACYFAVLRRSPDEEGMANHLSHLRSGALSKVELIAALRWSPEGNSKGVHIDGLLIPYTVQKWRRKRFIGPLVGYAQGLVRLPRLFDRIALLDARQAGDMHGMGDFVTGLSQRLERTVHELQRSLSDSTQARFDLVERAAGEAASRGTELAASFEKRSGKLEQEVHLLAQTLDQALDAIGKLSQAVDDHEDRHERLLAELASRAEAADAHLDMVLDAHAARNSVQDSTILHHKIQLETLAARLDALEQEKTRNSELEHALDPLYVAFEEEFRGTPELIRQRVAPYVAVMQDAQVGTHLTPILDVGCGRGDLLEVLRENGLVARGVDCNRLFVDLCRGRGLDVVAGDALETLRELPEGSLGAVTGLHIAEHLPFEVLISLIDECRRVLCIGGVLLLETPNPENLLVATELFYMDPTHRNPLPPEALHWFVEARGFQLVRTVRLTLGRSLDTPPLLGEEIPGADSVNFLLRKTHAAPDYAIIARRLQ